MHCSDDNPHSPWLCHVCNRKSSGESTACSVCYMTTCFQHLKHRTVLNRESGLYELQPVCVSCELQRML
jgi:hypothetical protein